MYLTYRYLYTASILHPYRRHHFPIAKSPPCSLPPPPPPPPPLPFSAQGCSTLPVRWNNFGGNKPKTDVTARTHRYRPPSRRYISPTHHTCTS